MKCDNCPLTQCDWLDKHCRLSPREVVIFRPDLIKEQDRRAYFRAYHQANREKRLAAFRLYIRTDKAEYYLKNREARLEYQRAYDRAKAKKRVA
jgi:hypothetical protein